MANSKPTPVKTESKAPAPVVTDADKKPVVVSKENVLKPEEDTAVLAAKGESSSEGSKTQDYADTSESKDKLKEHKDFVKDVADGKVAVNAESPSDLSAAVTPLVADPISGEAKYVTADSWFRAESSKGNL